MKKMFLFLGLAAYAGNLSAADTCGTNYFASDDYIQIAENDQCSTYGEYYEDSTTLPEIKIVADGSGCGDTNYTGNEPASSTPDIVHGYCDITKGSCKTATGPYESNCS